MHTYPWLLLWSSSLSLQALSQWRRTRVHWPLVAHVGSSQFPDDNSTLYFPMGWKRKFVSSFFPNLVTDSLPPASLE